MSVYLTVMFRVAVAFSTLLLLTRLAGKRQLAQLTFFDFITAIAAGDIAANHVINPDEPLLRDLVALFTWFGLFFLTEIVTLKFRRVGKLLEGEPLILIHKGKILEDKLAAAMLPVDNLMSMLRTKGYFDPREVEYAVLEPEGNLSVLPKPTHRPVQPGDLGLAPTSAGMSAEVIIEGRFFPQNLARFGRDERWLRQQLAAHGIGDLSEVFYCSINERGELYIDRYRDHIKVAVDISDYPGPN